MNSVEYLKEIGFKQIASKTHIEIEYLEWVVNKDFEKLSKKNVGAFTKILSREYDIDFSKWYEEFDEFLSQNADIKKGTAFVSPKIISYKPKETTSIAWKIIILLIVIFLAWFFDTFKYLDFIPKMLNDKGRSVKYTDSVIVEKAKENLDKSSSVSIISEKNATQTADENLDSIDKTELKKDFETKILQNDTKKENLEQSSSEKSLPQTQTIILEPSKDFDPFGLNSQNDSVIIKPRVDLWLGFVDLDSGNKKTLIIKNDFELDTSKNQLILTGHGNFSININGDENLPSSNKAKRYRYLVKDGKIQTISKDEFINLNKGEEW